MFWRTFRVWGCCFMRRRRERNRNGTYADDACGRPLSTSRACRFCEIADCQVLPEPVPQGSFPMFFRFRRHGGGTGRRFMGQGGRRLVGTGAAVGAEPVDRRLLVLPAAPDFRVFGAVLSP